MDEEKNPGEARKSQSLDTDLENVNNTTATDTPTLSESEKTSWWKRHKTKICSSAIFLSFGFLAVWLGKEKLEEVISDSARSSSENTLDSHVFPAEDCSAIVNENTSHTSQDSYEARIRSRSGHVRHLSGNRNPSQEKIQEADKNGWSLGPHETYVTQTEQTYYYRRD